MKITPETKVNLWWIATSEEELARFKQEALAAGGSKLAVEGFNLTFDIPLRSVFTILKYDVDSVWDTCSPRWDDDPDALIDLRRVHSEVTT